MKCSLLGDRARVLAKFLQFLSKIGQDLFIEASTTDGLLLGTSNPSSSGFCRIQLWPSFFTTFQIPDSQEDESCCRVSIKACAAIFRSMKNVETCDIRMNQRSAKLIIQLHCRQNTTKTHFVSILENEIMSAPSRNTASLNTLTASQKVFSDILSIFNNSEEELTILANRKGITVKNYIESIHVNRQQMRTQLTLDPAEFDTYVVDNETSVSFCLKEWRAFLVLAESLNSNIAIRFETTGMPIEFTIQDLDVFDVTLIMATLSSELDSSYSSGAVSVPVNADTTANGGQKRANETSLDDELQTMFKKAKAPKKRQVPEEQSKMQFSNPEIEEFTNNDSLGSTSRSIRSSNNNRWTVARNEEGGNQSLNVPTIAPRLSTVSPVATNNQSLSNVEVIFLKDTDEDTDRTLLSIAMPNLELEDDVAHKSTRDRSINDSTEIPESPVETRSQQARRTALSMFRRCYEPSFKVSNVSALNRILAENSSDEDDK